MNGPEVEQVEMSLERLGTLPWSVARGVLAGCSCAWLDLDGFHIEDEAPEDLPLGTHLWAWDTGRAIRVRIDGDAARVAALHADPDDAVGREPVLVHKRRGLTWDPGDHQVGPLPASAHGLDLELLEMHGPQPVTFVRPLPPAGQESGRATRR